MGKIGVGIIGCGGISNAHVKGYLKLADQCKIRAVSDLVVEKAEYMANSLGSHVSAYTDYREMLERNDIDVVSICTPPSVHKEPVLAALAAKKHVLCEKPFAPSLRDCDEMIAASEENQRKLAVVFQYRYRQDFRQVKHILQSNTLGPIVYAQMNAQYCRGDKYYSVPWRGKFATECGGVTMNHAIHPLDIFLWLMGDVESVNAEMETVAHQIEVEDVSMATIRFTNGALAQINCTVNSVIPMISMTISGKTKAVSLADATTVTTPHFHAIVENDRGNAISDIKGIDELHRLAAQVEHGINDHTGPISDLFDAIRENREPVVNGREGRRSIETITAIYKSATLGKRVALPISQDDQWYTTEGILQNVKKSPMKI